MSGDEHDDNPPKPSPDRLPSASDVARGELLVPQPDKPPVQPAKAQIKTTLKGAAIDDHVVTSEEKDPKTEARLQTHWALQVAAAASTHIVPDDDDVFTTLSWSEVHGALVGQPVAMAGGARAGLRIADLALLIVEGEGEGKVTDQQGLGGMSLREAFGWMSQQLKRRGAPRDVEPLPHDLPFHGVSQGLLFNVDADAQQALSDRHAFTWSTLRARAEREEGASPVRCWPHHFDSATLITLPDQEDVAPEARRSIGVGMSPGDATYAEPYWYVTPWPYPDGDVTLPLLAARGRWHLTGFMAAVLLASQYEGANEAKAHKAVADFLDTGIGACRTLLSPR